MKILFLFALIFVVFLLRIYIKKTGLYLFITFLSIIVLDILFAQLRFLNQVENKIDYPSIFLINEKYTPDCLNPKLNGITKRDGIVIFGNHLNNFTRATNRKNPDNYVSSQICCFGGSSTYCIGLNEKETWPSLLENKFSKERISVNNHGIPGHNTSDEVYNYKNHKCSSDLTILYNGWNDMRLRGHKFMTDCDNFALKYHKETNIIQTRILNTSPAIDECLLRNRYLFTPSVTKLISNIYYNIFRGTYFDNLILNNLIKVYLKHVDNEIKSELLLESKFVKSKKIENFKKYFIINTIKVINKIKKSNPKSKILLIPQVLNFNHKSFKNNMFKIWMPGIIGKSAKDYCFATLDCYRYLSRKDTSLILVNTLDNHWEDSDFLDDGHFSKIGCEKFTNIIYKSIKSSQIQL
jgi:hypothetical protein